MKGTTAMEVGADGVAVITIVNPPVNSLSLDVLQSLKESFDEALQRKDVKAIVVTGAKGKFSGGFDISAFGGIQKGNVASPKRGFVAVDILTDTVDAARKPSVAAIDGLALGGGLEVAMACHARISTSNAQLGLPELQLGVIPGFGGTQRLPRLVGLSKALEMMLTSKPIKGSEAHDLGLVDAVVPENELLNTARRWALEILECKKPWVSSLHKTDKLEPLGEAREILKFARAQARKQAPNLSHPLVCIDVIEEGIASGPRAGLWKEADAFEELLRSDTCKSLVHIFFAQRGTSKVPGVTDLGLSPKKIKKVAVIGGGLMGSGIATALILSGYHVVLKEVNQKFLEAGIGRVKANLQSRVKKGKMTEEKLAKTMSLIQGSLDYDSFRDVEMVIEAVIENVSLKQQIFSDLEKYCPPHCVLASNTSTIDLNLIGEKTRSQDRIIGAHFFSPAHIMPLLEIVRTQKTSPQAIVDVLDLGKKIKKTPVIVGNCTGFAVNRMFFPYTQAAMLLVEHGVDLYKIDRAITKFGMPMGPFRLIDLVGFGVAIATAMQYIEHFSERTYKSMIIPLMQEDKRAGESTRKGFYVYDDRRKANPDPEVKKYIEKAREISGISIDPKSVVDLGNTNITSPSWSSTNTLHHEAVNVGGSPTRSPRPSASDTPNSASVNLLSTPSEQGRCASTLASGQLNPLDSSCPTRSLCDLNVVEDIPDDAEARAIANGVVGEDEASSDEDDIPVAEPAVGMVFHTVDDVKEFYKRYGFSKGFGVIAQRSSNKNGQRRHSTFFCECFGNPEQKYICNLKNKAKDIASCNIKPKDLRDPKRRGSKNVSLLP